MNSRRKTGNLLLFIVFLLALILVPGFFILSEEKRDNIEVAEGEIAKSTIRSPKTVVFESQSKTSELQDEAVKKVQKVYKLDQSAYARQEEIIKKTFDQISSLASDTNLSQEERESRLTNIVDNSFSVREVQRLANEKNISLLPIKEEVLEVNLALQETETISEENISETKKQIASQIKSSLSADDRELVNKLSSALLISNSIVDETRTQLQKEQTLANVEPVYYQLQKDEIILTKDKVVDVLSIEKLEAAGLLSPTFALQEKIGVFAIVACLSFLLLLYLKKDSTPRLGFVTLASIITAASVISILALELFFVSKPIVVYLVPVAAVAVVVMLLSNFRLGLFVAVYLSIIIALAAGNLLDVLVIQLVVSVFSLWILRSVERFSDLLRSTLAIALIDFILMIGFHFLVGTLDPTKALQLFVVAVAFSLTMVTIVVATLISVGAIFKVATFPILLELANPSSPLLRELSIKAPGTYHHSLIVGSLAERAAKKIGANVLLTKVAAFYHDVGKLDNPGSYIENQHHSKPDISDPKKEADKVMSHVRDGLRIGKKNRLPQEILDVISSHHGTSIVLYFYNLSDKSTEKDFRYPGPKPQSKESAIIMLADAVEAYVRAQQREKDFDANKAVAKIIFDRLNDRQLDNSSLTLKEIDRIRRVFVEVIASVYHQRIKYD